MSTNKKIKQKKEIKHKYKIKKQFFNYLIKFKKLHIKQTFKNVLNHHQIL